MSSERIGESVQQRQSGVATGGSEELEFLRVRGDGVFGLRKDDTFFRHARQSAHSQSRGG